MRFAPLARCLAVLCPALLAGCTDGDDGGSLFGNLFRYGGTTVPPLAINPRIEAVDCPAVTVMEGGAAIRSGGGGEGVQGIRSQISIANVARECIEQPDGSVRVKVGVQGRALLGPGGGAGHFDTPVTIALKRGDRMLVSRVRRASITIPPGQAGADFTVVEDDLVAPAGTGEFEIEVGLGGHAAGSPAPVRRRRARG